MAQSILLRNGAQRGTICSTFWHTAYRNYLIQVTDTGSTRIVIDDNVLKNK